MSMKLKMICVVRRKREGKPNAPPRNKFTPSLGWWSLMTHFCGNLLVLPLAEGKVRKRCEACFNLNNAIFLTKKDKRPIYTILKIHWYFRLQSTSTIYITGKPIKNAKVFSRRLLRFATRRCSACISTEAKSYMRKKSVFYRSLNLFFLNTRMLENSNIFGGSVNGALVTERRK